MVDWNKFSWEGLTESDVKQTEKFKVDLNSSQMIFQKC